MAMTEQSTFHSLQACKNLENFLLCTLYVGVNSNCGVLPGLRDTSKFRMVQLLFLTWATEEKYTEAEFLV